jgi:hypothetical protein
MAVGNKEATPVVGMPTLRSLDRPNDTAFPLHWWNNSATVIHSPEPC